MNIEDNNLSIVALTPYSFGTGRTVSEAVKQARINILWKKVNPLEVVATITVYICHPKTAIDASTGNLNFPIDKKPMLIDSLETQRPTKIRRIK